MTRRHDHLGDAATVDLYCVVLDEAVSMVCMLRVVDGQDGWTALMIACHNGHTECASLLMDRGAKLEATENVPLPVISRVASDHFVFAMYVVVIACDWFACTLLLGRTVTQR